MAKAEELVTEIITRFENETLARIRDASEDGKAQITKFVSEYIAGLQIEMPLSIKQVLDSGGQVQQRTFEHDLNRGPCWIELVIQGSVRNHKLDFHLPSAKAVRVTFILEPLN